MTSPAAALSFHNPVLRAYVYYSNVLVLKILAMVHLTRVLRLRKKIYVSHEDCLQDARAIVKYDDPDIERVRRAHMNDLETILPFIVAAFAYTLTSPEPTFAVNLMQLFTAARVVHTFVYAVVVMPQPMRCIMYWTGFIVPAYMGLVSFAYFFLL